MNIIEIFETKNAIKKEIKNFKKQIGLDKDKDKDSEKDKSQKSRPIEIIDWSDKNFPRRLNLMHYDPEDDQMPDPARKISKWIYNIFRATIVQLFMNLIWTIIAGAVGSKTALNVLYSVLFLIIGGITSSFAFYLGYKGVAGDSKRIRHQYLAFEGVLCFFMILFSFLGTGSIHGWSGINTANQNNEVFTFICVIESLCYTGLYSATIYTLYQTYRYPGHGSWVPEKRQKKVDKDGKEIVTETDKRKEIHKKKQRENIIKQKKDERVNKPKKPTEEKSQEGEEENEDG